MSTTKLMGELFIPAKKERPIASPDAKELDGPDTDFGWLMWDAAVLEQDKFLGAASKRAESIKGATNP